MHLISLLDLCSYLGLGAVAMIGMNLVLGALLALRYSPLRLWPHRHINLFALHRWTAYAAIALTLMHPTVLLFLRTPKFSILQILWPIHSFLQPKLNLTGAIALYLLLIVLVSSLLRSRIGRPLWRNLHYLVYPATVLLLVHSMLTDPELKDGHPDLLDGGKVFIAISMVVISLVGLFRARYRVKGFRSYDVSSSSPPENLRERS